MPLKTPADVREELVYALRDDLIGPDPDDRRDAAHLTETLSAPPSSWYLTGFLAPFEQKNEDKEDPEADETLDSALEGPEEGETEAPAARRPVFPSSIGLSVLIRPSVKHLHVRATYGTYVPFLPNAEESNESEAGEKLTKPASDDGPTVPVTKPKPAYHWRRLPHEYSGTLDLSDGPRIELPLDGSEGVVLLAMLRPVPENELGLVPTGTRYVTLFLINRRVPIPRPEQDRGYIFQVGFSVNCPDGEALIPRPNLRGAREEDDIDERIGDLHYRDVFEYAVGHGISTVAQKLDRDGKMRGVATCWAPKAEVEKVAPSTVLNVELGMDALGKLSDGETLRAAVAPLVTEYQKWLGKQEESAAELTNKNRREMATGLLKEARRACARIERGIAVLAEDSVALEAFRIANRVMAAQTWQRKGAQLKAEGKVPSWYPFQLAFLLMNVAAQVKPTDPEREEVDLIFFPTGGGKTEAYLGLAAFVMVLRRLRTPTLQSGGVAVLMRYTLRLLTLDQLERAATLICALELERRKDPTKLGPQRFSIGLWVGKAATPNRFGTDQDHDPTTARNRVLAFNKDPRANPAPIPIDKCPWCGTSFDQDTFALKPSSQAPLQLRIACGNPKCEFRWQREFTEGIPVLAVDDEIYRELPPFLIATVDKFAGLPWVGKTGLLLGRDVTHHNTYGFFGPAQTPPDAKRLPGALLPPDLIVQDELHLISGPLGTMVGLYETVIDHLTTREVDGQRVRPKIVASTATARRARTQIRALFGRDQVAVFPPPGPNRRTSFFAETVETSQANARMYLGLAAPGRSQKVLLMRGYIALLAASQRAFLENPEAADPYMTLVGYFNSLRELGGSQRIVEDEVRNRLMRISMRRREGDGATYFAERTIDIPCVELTSRKSTDDVKRAKERLEQRFVGRSGAAGKGVSHAPVNVALASNMISVGVDIQRLGLMVVCSQPKTTAEYIQATSRVGRDAKRPGLVVTLLNIHKPRDRSHFEHFATFHESFYRGVEATSVTPFSPRAIDRGLAGVTVALARLGHPMLTAPDAAADLSQYRDELSFVANALASRLEAHKESQPDDDPIDEVKSSLRQRIDSLLDSWACVVKNDPAKEGLVYQKHEEGQHSKRPLLHMPLDPELEHDADAHERRFVANRSLRDVEATLDMYVTKLKEAGRTRALAEEEGR